MDLIPAPRFDKRKPTRKPTKDEAKLTKRLSDLIAYCNDTRRSLPDGATVEPIPAAEPEITHTGDSK
jgi:hypothetical protein